MKNLFQGNSYKVKTVAHIFRYVIRIPEMRFTTICEIIVIK